MQPFYERMAENKDGGNLARDEKAVLWWTASEKNDTVSTEPKAQRIWTKWNGPIP